MIECIVEWCRRHRIEGSSYCDEHLVQAWRNTLPPEEHERRESAWVRRMREGNLPPKELAA